MPELVVGSIITIVISGCLLGAGPAIMEELLPIKTFHKVAFPLSNYIGSHGGPETVKLLLAWQLLVALMSCHVVERQSRV